MFRFVWFIALYGTAIGFQEPAGSLDYQREKDVYTIYSLLMTNPRTSHGPDDNPRYLIAAMTEVGHPQEPCVRPPKEREADFGEVLADFERRKSTPRTLKRELSIRKPYELLNADEVKAFRNERAWPKPERKVRDERFQGVTDLFTFSDVYFNERGTLVLTTASSWCGGLCGLHQWKVFEKLTAGQWQERPWVGCMTIAGDSGLQHEVAVNR